jgi:nicotinate-nucleotide adenylyltransferase
MIIDNKITIIFGGSFNPPTIAHERILQACVDYTQNINADIWIMPSGNRADKQISTTRDIRIKYLDAMIKSVNHSNISIVTTELDREIYVETYDTLQRLLIDYPGRSFLWVYGADSIETMAVWKNGQWLLDNLDILVVKRNGSQIHPLAKKVTILPVDIPDGVSSTVVRRCLADGAPFDHLVNAHVKKHLNNIK